MSNARRPRRTHRAVAVCIALAASLGASPVRADDDLRLSVDWEKLAAVLREGPALLLAHESEHPDHAEGAEAMTAPWIGLSPRVSLIARDWGASQLLVGHLALTDQVRLTRSSRMVVSRVRLTKGRLAPFAQLGLGEWRVDTSLLPTLPADRELAGQLGAGFELTVAPRAVLAVEADWTLLCSPNDDAFAEAVAHEQLWGSFLAARAVF